MTRDQLLEYLEHFTLVTDGNRLAELIGRFTLGMGYDYYRFALILPMSMQRPKVVLFREFNFEVRHSPMPPDGTLRIP